jgi:hypothetical protein
MKNVTLATLLLTTPSEDPAQVRRYVDRILILRNNPDLLR